MQLCLEREFRNELKVVRVQKICILLQPIMTGQLNKHITAMASEYDRVRECDCYKRQAGMSTSSITPPTPCTLPSSAVAVQLYSKCPVRILYLVAGDVRFFLRQFRRRTTQRSSVRVGDIRFDVAGFHKIDPRCPAEVCGGIC